MPGWSVLSSTTIGSPYRDAADRINNTLNPFQAFGTVEGPIVSRVNSVVNGLGIPGAVNRAIEPVLHPVTAWAEDKVLFPRPDKPKRPIANVARQLLKRIAPNLGADSE